MSWLKQYWSSPEYRNSRFIALRRLKRQFKAVPTQEVLDETAWGLPIYCVPTDPLDSQIWYRGMVDIEVAESLWRLARHGTTTADVGANIGFMTGVLASRLDAGSQIFSFEPNPMILPRLRRNVEAWMRRPGSAKMTVVDKAVGDAPGVVTLYVPSEDGINSAVGTLEPDGSAFELHHKVEVQATTLDDLFPTETLDLLKLDVERHEAAVLRGASNMLAEGRVRTIVYEDLGAGDDDVLSILKASGFVVVGVRAGLKGPLLVRDDEDPEREPANRIATMEPDRVFRIMETPGWRCLARGQ